MWMRRGSRLVPLVMLAMAFAGCDRFKAAEETGCRGARGPGAGHDHSQEARDHYLIGRDLMDKLRIPEARRHLEQAVARDSTFAIAHYDLAISEATNQEFLEHLTRAVDLSGTASDGERLMIMALHAGRQRQADRAAEALRAARRRLSARSPRPLPARLQPGRPAGVRERDRIVHPRHRARSRVLAGLERTRLRVPAARPLRGGGARLQAVHRADPERAESLRLVRRAAAEDRAATTSRSACTGRRSRRIRTSWRRSSGSRPISCTAAAMRRPGPKWSASTARPAMTASGALARLTAAIVWADQGNTARALDELAGRQRIARRTGDTLAMAEDLGLMGGVLLEAGRPDEARNRFRQSLALVEQADLSPEIKQRRPAPPPFRSRTGRDQEAGLRRRADPGRRFHGRRGGKRQSRADPRRPRAARPHRTRPTERRRRDRVI